MSATNAPAAATERRTSLSRGPALIVGTILLAAGLYSMYRQHTYPHWSNFPNGGAPVDRHILGIFGVNGFTGLLTAACGGLLLFGAAEHFLSKTMSLIVGIVLGAAAIIGLVSGNVLGLAASNGWTELAWGISAAILLINVLMPARRTVYEPAGARTGRTARAAGAGAVAGAAAGDVAARRRERRAEEEDPGYARTGAGTAAGAGAGTGAATGAGTAAGTGGPTGAGAPAAAGAGTGSANARDEQASGNGAATEAEGGRDVNYTRRITGGSGASEPDQAGQGEAVGVGGGNAPTQQRPAQQQPSTGTSTSTGTGGSGGGALSRLFGRRN